MLEVVAAWNRRKSYKKLLFLFLTISVCVFFFFFCSSEDVIAGQEGTVGLCEVRSIYRARRNAAKMLASIGSIPWGSENGKIVLSIFSNPNEKPSAGPSELSKLWNLGVRSESRLWTNMALASQKSVELFTRVANIAAIIHAVHIASSYLRTAGHPDGGTCIVDIVYIIIAEKQPRLLPAICTSMCSRYVDKYSYIYMCRYIIYVYT